MKWKLREKIGGAILAVCFVGLVYCLLLRGQVCWHPRGLDYAKGYLYEYNCKSIQTHVTPHELDVLMFWHWGFLLGLGVGAVVSGDRR